MLFLVICFNLKGYARCDVEWLPLVAHLFLLDVQIASVGMWRAGLVF